MRLFDDRDAFLFPRLVEGHPGHAAARESKLWLSGNDLLLTVLMCVSMCLSVSQEQLMNFEKTSLRSERERVVAKYGESRFLEADVADLKKNIEMIHNRENEPIKVNRLMDKITDAVHQVIVLGGDSLGGH